MKKTVYLHVGNFKTGTSAIQYYLDKHKEEVRQAGYLYPDCLRPKNNPTNHGKLALSLIIEGGGFAPKWYTDEVKFDEQLEELISEIEASGLDSTIVSSEELFRVSRLKETKAVLKRLKTGLKQYDIKIVVYFREPLSFVKSWYSQVIKADPSLNFIKFVKRVEHSFMSQVEVYQAYADIFGSNNIITRQYALSGVEHLNGFMAAVNSEYRFKDTIEPVNKRIDDISLEEKRLSRLPQKERAAATRSNLAGLPALQKKIDAINAGYAKLEPLVDGFVASELSLRGGFQYYQTLLAPLVGKGLINQKEVDNLRDVALKQAKTNVQLGLLLMETAQVMRPTGALIKRQVELMRGQLKEAQEG